jgi:hypothetical protein
MGSRRYSQIENADGRRKSAGISEKKSALICEKRNRWVHADIRRLEAQMDAERRKNVCYCS